MRLTKHHGLGNDFLVLLDEGDAQPIDAELVRAVCDRRTGVGADGLLRVRVQESEKGPDRRVYSLTAAGRRQLRRWLASGPSLGDERFTYMAQFFFMAEQGDLNETLRFVKQARDAFRKRLQTFRGIDREWRAGSESFPAIESDDGFHMHLTLRMGLHRAEAAIKWCDETAQQIKERMASRSRGRGKQRRKK